MLRAYEGFGNVEAAFIILFYLLSVRNVLRYIFQTRFWIIKFVFHFIARQQMRR